MELNWKTIYNLTIKDKGLSKTFARFSTTVDDGFISCVIFDERLIDILTTLIYDIDPKNKSVVSHKFHIVGTLSIGTYTNEMTGEVKPTTSLIVWGIKPLAMKKDKNITSNISPAVRTEQIEQIANSMRTSFGQPQESIIETVEFCEYNKEFM